MSEHPKLRAFYRSQEWLQLRKVLIAERGPSCEHCGERVARAEELTLHHREHLTVNNVDDATIALNPENLMIVHHGCHNQLHRRAAKSNRERLVFIVYGPPMSGKSSHVREHAESGDLVVDMDLIYQGLTGQEMYDKPDRLLPNVRAVHSLLLDNIKTRYGKWKTAWVIGGYADKWKREKLAEDLGAELVYIRATKEECLDRLNRAGDYRGSHKREWAEYIENWFSTYRE